MPRIEYRPVNRVRSDCAWLLSHRANVTSQIGQDGIIRKIFEIIGSGGRYCVEFGAWDGRWLSNSYNLIANQGWSALLVESNPEKAALIPQTHPYPRVRHRCGFVGWEGPSSLEAILDQSDSPLEPDLISIDVDGNDYHIWQSLTRYRPRVILIEFNPTVPNDVIFVQDPDPSINQGSSLLALIELGREKGYSLVCADGWDAVFVLDDLYPLFGIPDNGIDAMFASDFEAKLFHGFDSTFYTAGHRRLVWKNVDFEPDQLQILSKDQRIMG